MLIISILFIISIFSLYNICKIRKLYLSLQPQTRNNGAIAQLVEQRTENPCVPGSIPGGTTRKNFSLLKSSEIQQFRGFFLFLSPTKKCRFKGSVRKSCRQAMLINESKLSFAKSA